MQIHLLRSPASTMIDLAKYLNTSASAQLIWCRRQMFTVFEKWNMRERESVNNSSTKDDSFVLGILPLNTNDDILSDSFLTFERQIQ